MYSSIALFIGHEVGDYLFQNDKMALLKSQKGEHGCDWCLFHCFVYALCVMGFVVGGGWRTNDLSLANSLLTSFFVAFLTHFWIDRHSFGWTWMKWIGQSKFDDNPWNKRNYFVGPVYIKVDNTMHLVLMWLLFSWLGK